VRNEPRFYGLPAVRRGGHSHLACMVNGYEDVACLVCLPNLPVMAEWSACEGGGSFEAGHQALEQWDQHCDEITCPTCLYRALTGTRLPHWITSE